MDEKNISEAFQTLTEYLTPQSVNRLISLAKEKGEIPPQLFFVSKQFISPRLMVLVSVFGGLAGIDRFVLKETGIGVLKLLTSGCIFVLWLVDIFSIKKKTIEYNEKLLQNVLMVL